MKTKGSETLFHPSMLCRDQEGKPLLSIEPSWCGIPINLYRSLIRAERGPCHLESPALIYCQNIEGKRCYQENGRKIDLVATPGMLEILCADYQREWGRWEATPGFTVVFHFTPEIVTHLAPELDQFDLHTCHMFFDDKIKWMVQELFGEANASTTPNRLYVESLSGALIARLSENYGVRSREVDSPGKLTATRRKRVVEYIETNLAKDLSICAMAKEIGLSPNHFSKCFTASFGQTPHGFVQNRRIERARRMLSISHKSITDIAFELGFNSHSHFTKIFRKHTGASPTQARTSGMTNVGVDSDN